MTAANIDRFIRGVHHLAARPDGLVRPSRMSDKQIAAASDAGREGEARTTAGTVIDLVTTGDEVSFDLSVLKDPRWSSSAVQRTMELASARADAEGTDAPDPLAGLVDGIDLVVDGAYVRTVPVKEGTVVLGFENPAHAPAEVTVYLPCLASVAVGNLATNGSLEEAPARGYLLALGDSITQGFVVGHPSKSWPARVARALGVDLVNQAISGHHFDVHTLRGMRVLREHPPVAIVVAYGTNDWAHTDRERDLVENMTKYLSRLADRFHDTPVYVVSPIWRADEDEPRPHGLTLERWRAMIAEECTRLGLRYVDGANLVPADTALFADGRLHPDADGAAHLAEGVLAAFAEDGLLEELGGRHDTPSALADAQTRLRAHAPGRQRELEEAARTIWRLRQADGCPWDKRQTHASIAKNMIEEAYEAVDAIESGDSAHLREELGDVLMQVLLHAQIAADAGEFTLADVCRDLDDKLVRRHPHVFGGASAASVSDVLGIWSAVKLEERRDAEKTAEAASGSDESASAHVGLLDSVPRALPALLQAQKISKKAAVCGFDWEASADVWSKVDEERDEYRAETPGSKGAEYEFGDVLFALVNVARKDGLDAESALRACCEKFRKRWGSMEGEARAAGKLVQDCSHEELEELWAKAKEDETH